MKNKRLLYAGLLLALVLAADLLALIWFFRPASLGARVGIPNGSHVFLITVTRNSASGELVSGESDAPDLCAEFSALLSGITLRYDSQADGIPIHPAAYDVTVYRDPAQKGTSFGVDSRGYVYQRGRCYSTAPEEGAQLVTLLNTLCPPLP